MLLVTLDLNALIGMQNAAQRPQWEAILADPQHLLVVTDHTFLEACRHGPDAVDNILRPLISYRDRVRVGRYHGELLKQEARQRRPISHSDLLAKDGRTESMQETLADMAVGRRGYAKFWDDATIAANLKMRCSPEATSALLRDRMDRLREGIAVTAKHGPKPEPGTGSFTGRIRANAFDQHRVMLCMRLAIREAKVNIKRLGGHWMTAEQLVRADSFSLRHELAYWLRSLQLVQGNRIGNWEKDGTDGELVNEHFDVEFVAMASRSDRAACKDVRSRDTMAMMDLALEEHFGQHRDAVAPTLPESTFA